MMRPTSELETPAPLAELLGTDGIAPLYGGGSIANLPPTIGHLLGVEEGWAAPPLEGSGMAQIGTADRVILLLLDGVGWNRLQREVRRGNRSGEPRGAGWSSLLSDERLRLESRLTSVVPATTSVATTVLLGNGAGPAETGMLGYTFLLPDLGVLANMLRWHPVAYPGVAGELERWGVVPERFLPNASLAQVLTSGNVETTALLPASIAGSPLSRMQLRGAGVRGYLNWFDMFWQLRHWTRETAGRKAFAYAYLSDFDASSHRDGPDDGLWSEQLSRLQEELLRFMDSVHRDAGRTVLLVTADHGHVATPVSGRTYSAELTRLPELTSLGPGGEARHVNLYARGGSKEELLAYCREVTAHSFHVLDADEALQCGLYGPLGRIHPQTIARLGDVLLLAKGHNYLWDRASSTTLAGMHGSVEPDEMLVPLLAFEL